MMEWPAAPNLTLTHLQQANRVLVSCGASISEINSVRRAFSAVKGGKLASRAPNCDQVTLIVSDVPTGQEYNVASGPTLQSPANAPEALDVITRYDLRSQLPAEILQTIETPREFSTKSASQRSHFVLLSNDHALRAAETSSQKLGFLAETVKEIADEQIAEGCEGLMNRLRQNQSKGPVCLISGGEFSCRVNGEGIGGRNLETALRLAMLGANSEQEFVAVCAGTDGIDGNSRAAGAAIDNTTIERAKAIGLDANDFLQRSDAFSFFHALGDAIITGPTGTNVRDLRIVLRG